MAETKISVIIPTYRPGDYIKECLASLVEQTFPHNRFEVIVVLNGDKEPYFTLLQTYITERCRGLDIKLLHTGTKGVSNARNMAIDIARGEFISFIDDDDYVSGTYLEELYFKAAESTIVICCPKAFKDGDPTPLSYRPAELFRRLAPDGRQDFLRARSLLHITCMKLIPREMIGSRRYDTSFSIGEDTLMMFTISDKLKYVDFTSEHAIYYRRIRNSSAVSAFQRERISCRIKNSLRLSFKYASIYSGNPFEYSFVFMLTRIWGAIHSIVKL